MSNVSILFLAWFNCPIKLSILSQSPEEVIDFCVNNFFYPPIYYLYRSSIRVLSRSPIYSQATYIQYLYFSYARKQVCPEEMHIGTGRTCIEKHLSASRFEPRCFLVGSDMANHCNATLPNNFFHLIKNYESLFCSSLFHFLPAENVVLRMTLEPRWDWGVALRPNISTAQTAMFISAAQLAPGSAPPWTLPLEPSWESGVHKTAVLLTWSVIFI